MLGDTLKALALGMLAVGLAGTGLALGIRAVAGGRVTAARSATISATDQPKMRDGFAPLLPGFHVVPFDDLDAAKARDRSDNTAGFLVEPIQGEGGIRPASQEFMTGLRALCDEHDLMLVLDEVQCGVRRTGKLFAYEHYGIEPDIMAVGQGRSAAASRWAPASRPRKRRPGW